MLQPHCSPEQLTDLLRGALPDEIARSVRSHLSSCAACAAEASRIEDLRQALAEAASAGPPPEVVERAYGLFRPAVQLAPGLGERVRHLVAELLSDSARAALPAGVRGGDVPRQFLFETENAEVALKLLPGEAGRTMSLYGQIARRGQEGGAGGVPVEFVPESGGNRHSVTDRFGEFVFEDLPHGEFAVAFGLDETLVTVGPLTASSPDS